MNRLVVVNVVTIEEFRSGLCAVDIYLKTPRKTVVLYVCVTLGMLSTEKEINDAHGQTSS